MHAAAPLHGPIHLPTATTRCADISLFIISAIVFGIALTAAFHDGASTKAPNICTHIQYDASSATMNVYTPVPTTYMSLIRYTLAAILIRAISHFAMACITPPSSNTDDTIPHTTARRSVNPVATPAHLHVASHTRTAAAVASALPATRTATVVPVLGMLPAIIDALLVTPIVYHAGVTCRPYIAAIICVYMFVPVLLYATSRSSAFLSIVSVVRILFIIWLFVSVGVMHSKTIAFVVIDVVLGTFIPNIVCEIMRLASALPESYILAIDITLFIRFIGIATLSILSALDPIRTVSYINSGPFHNMSIPIWTSDTYVIGGTG